MLWFALVLAGLDFCSPADQQPWSYNNQGQWPGECLIGKRQSPINIDTEKAWVDYGEWIKSPLHFERYSAVKLRGLNNGHTVQFNVEGDEALRPTLSGGPLRRAYVLDQLHFHWPGEHSFNRVKYPVEIHFVHHRKDLQLEDAMHKKDGIVVVAVMCKLSTYKGDDRALRNLVKYVPQLVNASAQVAVEEEVDLLRTLSPVLDSYYTYEGSLTTPDCLEIVTWIVQDKPLRITDEQYKAFTAVDVGGIANFRSLQPLNGRKVYRSPTSSAILTRPQGLLTGAGTAAVALLSVLKNSMNTALKIKKTVFDNRSGS